MKNFQFLPHTADIRLQIEGSTLKELFEAGIQGMAEVIKKGSCSSRFESKSKKIDVASVDLTSLLIDFLSEVLTYSQEEGVVYCRVKFLKIKDKELQAEVYGRAIGNFDEDIKAVTYHEAEIKKNGRGNWEVVIVFDI